jgi:hypothetical protein
MNPDNSCQKKQESITKNTPKKEKRAKSRNG